MCEKYDSRNILTKTNYENVMVMQLMMEETRRVGYIFILYSEGNSMMNPLITQAR